MEQCNKVGEELIDALQKAKVQGAHKRWKSVRQALKSVLGRDKIQELYDRLKQYREDCRRLASYHQRQTDGAGRKCAGRQAEHC